MPPKPNDTPQQTPQHFPQLNPDPDYNLPGGDLHLIAGHTLFRIHGVFLARESNTFKNNLLPMTDGKYKLGTSSATAHIIYDATAEEFRQFLWIFYNPHYAVRDAPVEQWKVILKLAEQWGFAEAKKLAILELEEKKEISSVERIVLYQTYKVEHKYLLPYYTELCARDSFISIEEAAQLGAATAYTIFKARELLRAKPTDGGRSPLPQGLDEYDIKRTLMQLLGGDKESQTNGKHPTGRLETKAVLKDLKDRRQTLKPRRLEGREVRRGGELEDGKWMDSGREKTEDSAVTKHTPKASWSFRQQSVLVGTIAWGSLLCSAYSNIF